MTYPLRHRTPHKCEYITEPCDTPAYFRLTFIYDDQPIKFVWACGVHMAIIVAGTNAQGTITIDYREAH